MALDEDLSPVGDIATDTGGLLERFDTSRLEQATAIEV